MINKGFSMFMDMRYLRVLFVLISLCPCATYGEMTISVEQVSPLVANAIGYSGSTVYLDGSIETDTPVNVSVALNAHRVKGGVVFLNSLGGRLFAGMELGRLLRKQGFSTHVGKKGIKESESPPLKNARRVRQEPALAGFLFVAPRSAAPVKLAA